MPPEGLPTSTNYKHWHTNTQNLHLTSNREACLTYLSPSFKGASWANFWPRFDQFVFMRPKNLVTNKSVIKLGVCEVCLKGTTSTDSLMERFSVVPVVFCLAGSKQARRIQTCSLWLQHILGFHSQHAALQPKQLPVFISLCCFKWL